MLARDYSSSLFLFRFLKFEYFNLVCFFHFFWCCLFISSQQVHTVVLKRIHILWLPTSSGEVRRSIDLEDPYAEFKLELVEVFCLFCSLSERYLFLAQFYSSNASRFFSWKHSKIRQNQLFLVSFDNFLSNVLYSFCS